jgi:FemAB-related protein (PEP-CTERM system-associated)
VSHDIGTDLQVVPFQESWERWDQVVQELPDSSFCHLSGWRHVMEEALGHESMWWSAVDARGRCHGLLPLVHVRSRLFGDYLLSMPFLNYGGPIGSGAAQQVLSRAAVAEAKKRDVDLLELRSRVRLPVDLQVSDRKLFVTKSLPDSSEKLWEEGLRAKRRNKIRQPMNKGVTARIADDLVDDFYPVFAHAMRDLGTPVLPKRFFEMIARKLSGHVMFAVAEFEGKTLAAGCGFFWQGEFEITWAGALREFTSLGPNMLLYWTMMEECIRRGAHTFNFGRCSPGSGTHRFKQEWGTEDNALHWAQWSPTGVIATPSPDSAKYRWATKVWSRLPLPVTTTFGPFLARELP